MLNKTNKLSSTFNSLEDRFLLYFSPFQEEPVIETEELEEMKELEGTEGDIGGIDPDSDYEANEDEAFRVIHKTKKLFSRMEDIVLIKNPDTPERILYRIAKENPHLIYEMVYNPKISDEVFQSLAKMAFDASSSKGMKACILEPRLLPETIRSIYEYTGKSGRRGINVLHYIIMCQNTPDDVLESIARGEAGAVEYRSSIDANNNAKISIKEAKEDNSSCI